MKSRLKLRAYITPFSLCFLAALLITTPHPTSALSRSNLTTYGINGIYYYDPRGSEDSCIIATGSYSGTTSVGLNNLQAGFIDAYHDIAAQLSVEYGIPWEAVMAQGILESGSGTSAFARQRNNFFGIGAFDSNPNAAYSYETPEAGWRGYFENIRRTSTYRSHGIFQNDYTINYRPKPSSHTNPTRNNITNPFDYLQTVWDSGYATDSRYYEKIVNGVDGNPPILPAIIARAHEKGWKTSEELAAEYPEMLTNAASFAAGAGSATSSSIGSVTNAVCIPQGDSSITTPNGGSLSQGNGDINNTALALAWPVYGEHDKNDPSPAYRTALATLGTGITANGDAAVRVGASCDVFVSTVMRYSGVDPNYPFFLGSQINYLRNNPNLYANMGPATSTANVQPGDIRIRGSHVELVVRRSDGSLGIASASHNDRTAELQNYYTDSSYIIYRHL